MTLLEKKETSQKVTFERMIAAVAAEYERPKEEVLSPQPRCAATRHKQECWDVAMYLSRVDLALKVKDIAAHFGAIYTGRVQESWLRIDTRLPFNRELAERIERIRTNY